VKEQLIEFIKNNEGLSLKAYRDNKIKEDKGYSIGYGTSSFKGEVITKEEAEHRCINHIQTSLLEFSMLFAEEIKQINNSRKIALIDMIYNMGITSFKGFKNMITEIECDYGINWANAGFECQDSNYHREFIKLGSKRSIINARILRNGFIK